MITPISHLEICGQIYVQKFNLYVHLIIKKYYAFHCACDTYSVFCLL